MPALSKLVAASLIFSLGALCWALLASPSAEPEVAPLPYGWTSIHSTRPAQPPLHPAVVALFQVLASTTALAGPALLRD